jgi:hypothetical protein
MKTKPHTIKLDDNELAIVKRALCSVALRLVVKLDKVSSFSRPDFEQRIDEINALLESLPEYSK